MIKGVVEIEVKKKFLKICYWELICFVIFIKKFMLNLNVFGNCCRICKGNKCKIVL